MESEVLMRVGITFVPVEITVRVGITLKRAEITLLSVKFTLCV
jgi:hypothetical protein